MCVTHNQATVRMCYPNKLKTLRNFSHSFSHAKRVLQRLRTVIFPITSTIFHQFPKKGVVPTVIFSEQTLNSENIHACRGRTIFTLKNVPALSCFKYIPVGKTTAHLLCAPGASNQHWHAQRMGPHFHAPNTTQKRAQASHPLLYPLPLPLRTREQIEYGRRTEKHQPMKATKENKPASKRSGAQMTLPINNQIEQQTQHVLCKYLL